MQSAEFNEIVEAKILEIQNTLLKKGKEYAPGADTDRLANFRKAAHLQGINMKQALQGMQAKHIVSIADMIASGEDYPQEVWDEKIGDALVYFLLLTTVIIEEKHEGETFDDVPAGSYRTFYNVNELNKYAADRDYALVEVMREEAVEGDLVLWSEEKGSYFVYRPLNREELKRPEAAKDKSPLDELKLKHKIFYDVESLSASAQDRDIDLVEVTPEEAAGDDVVFWFEEKQMAVFYRPVQRTAFQGGAVISTDSGSNKIETRTVDGRTYMVFKTFEDAKRHYPGKKFDVQPIHWLTPGKSIFIGSTHYQIES